MFYVARYINIICMCEHTYAHIDYLKVESYITVLLFTELPLNTYVLYLFIYSFIHLFVYLWLDKCACTVFIIFFVKICPLV